MTDCARISLEFATAEGLERAATFVLQVASTFKNRVANPTDEGYCDLMFTALIGGHVCEVLAAPLPCLLPCRPATPAASRGMGRGGGLLRCVSLALGAWVVREGVASAAPRRSHEVRRAFRRRCSCTWWR